MRIAISNWTNAVVGGVERYLQRIIPELQRRGFETAFICEESGELGKETIVLSGAPIFCLATEGEAHAFERLRNWRPDLIFANHFNSTEAETQLFSVAPTVFFAHNYHGTCISGRKSFVLPRLEPCNRKFGPACLFEFYPRRCGGLSPITMLEDYRRNAKSLQNLRRCAAIVVASEHMRLEFVRHGLADSVHLVHYPIPGAEECELASLNSSSVTSFEDSGRSVELLFAGRMEFAKGGHLLIEGAERLSRSIGRKIHLTMLGDGPLRGHWEQLAAAIAAKNPKLTFTFKGWYDSADLVDTIKFASLLVVPSLWPEPFGMIGPEAGIHSLPAAAFAIGGVGEWLLDGVNGHLASAHPTTSEGLASSIHKCIVDPVHYGRLRLGARTMAAKFTTMLHVAKLIEIFRAQENVGQSCVQI